AAVEVAGMAETSVRALAKVVQVMPARLRRRVDALRAMTVPAAWGAQTAGGGVEPAVLTTVALACRDGERITFAYTAADGARTDRSVEPFRLVSLGRRWYLVGYDLDRGDWRSFRLDRLAGPQGTGARFAPRRLPAPDAAAFVRDRIVDLPRGLAVGAVGDGRGGRTAPVPGARGRRQPRLAGDRARDDRRRVHRRVAGGAARPPARDGPPLHRGGGAGELADERPAEVGQVEDADQPVVVDHRQVVDAVQQHRPGGGEDVGVGGDDDRLPPWEVADPHLLEVAPVGHRLRDVGVGDHRDR